MSGEPIGKGLLLKEVVLIRFSGVLKIYDAPPNFGKSGGENNYGK